MTKKCRHKSLKLVSNFKPIGSFISVTISRDQDLLDTCIHERSESYLASNRVDLVSNRLRLISLIVLEPVSRS